MTLLIRVSWHYHLADTVQYYYATIMRGMYNRDNVQQASVQQGRAGMHGTAEHSAKEL